MLEPQERLSVYDILRPPTGFAIDVLIACTYSASLDTVLSLPTAMLADLPGMAKRKPGIFTAVELAALKRVCDRTLIFCQGGRFTRRSICRLRLSRLNLWSTR
jgi:hypothetical protein